MTGPQWVMLFSVRLAEIRGDRAERDAIAALAQSSYLVYRDLAPTDAAMLKACRDQVPMMAD